MLIDFNRAQLEKFDELAQRILDNPADYIQFDSVADFYRAEWLDDFPQGTVWSCTGLDDGAEHFYAVIRYKNRKFNIDFADTLTLDFKILDNNIFENLNLTI